MGQTGRSLPVLPGGASARLVATVLCSLCLISVLLLFPVEGRTQAEKLFKQVEIEAPFRDLLVRYPVFMDQGGARLFEGDDGRLVLIGIGKVFPEDHRAEAMSQVRRKGEIRARAAILELGESIEISTVRRQREGSLISLSSFFQVTETRVEGMIRQLPVVGSWWSRNHSTFYVAVGKMVDPDSHQLILTDISSPLSGGGNTDSHNAMEGEEPFLSLLRASPVLCQNAGVRGFLFENDRKALIAVGSARVQGSLAKTRRIGQLKAVRSLLANSAGIQLSSVEYLADREHLKLCRNGEQRISLSQFLSLQEERVSGVVKGLPIVVTWKDADGQVLCVAIGKLFDNTEGH